MKKHDNKTTPILPFDITYGEHMAMYDNMTYVKDVALIDGDSVRMESGNVIKFYRCAPKNPRLIGGDKTGHEEEEEESEDSFKEE